MWFPYPMYFFFGALTYMSSTTPSSCCFGALSMFWWSVYSFVSRVNLYLRAVCLMPVDLGGIVGF